LLCVDLIGVAVQMVMLVILNVLFYLDEPNSALKLCIIFALSNCILTMASTYAGPSFYGYGFAVAGLLTSAVGLNELSLKLRRLEYDTFMMQRAVY
jgi:polysaccharide biosynthesis protein PelG